MEINLFSIPPFIASILTLLLGFFIYNRNRTSSQNIAYSLECLSVFLWFLAYGIMFSCKDERMGSLWGKVGYAGVTFIPITFYHFTVSLLNIKDQKNIIRGIYIIGGVFLLFLFFTNYYISGVNTHFWGFYTKASFIHPLYLLFFMILYGGSLVLLFKHMKLEDISLQQKNRIKYVFWAFFIPAFASVDFTPSYGFDFYPFGHIFIFAWLSITAYAIVKHQLMEIEVIIRRAVVFAGLFAAVYGVFAFFTFLTQDILQNITGGNRWTALIPSILIIILALRPLQDFLIRITDRFLFQKKYDYRELLRALSREVMSIMDLDKLTNRVVDDLINIVRLENCAILVFDRDKEVYKIISSKGLKDKDITFKKEDPLIIFLQTTHTHIVKGAHTERMDDRGTIKEDMKKLNAEFILPLIIHDELIGLISLGMKKSGEEYNQDDIAVLESLAGTASVAVSNAQYVVSTMQLEAEAAQKEKMAVIGTLAAGINHEICNPLGIARGQCEVFLLNYKEGFFKKRSKDEQLAEAMKIMDKVIHEADRATSITKKLSSFAKPSKGEISYDVSIKDELNEAMALVGHELKLNKIDVNINIPTSLPFIACDRKQLQQILFNIIRNASQAIGEKGIITIGAEAKDTKLRVDISDTGHGIPKDKLNEIFNPFYTTKEPGKGTGLGLFIVRQLVERNRGKISVASEVGKGTTFTLEFPISEKVKV